MKLDYVKLNDMIKKAKWVHVYVQTCEDDGVYIQTTKTHLRKAMQEQPHHFDADRFDLTPFGGLYVN